MMQMRAMSDTDHPRTTARKKCDQKLQVRKKPAAATSSQDVTANGAEAGATVRFVLAKYGSGVWDAH